jgi:beta-galactosidase/beta-glucuronidase
VLPVPTVAVTALVPLVYYTGAYLTMPLTDATAAAFNVSVRVHFTAPAGGATGVLTVAGAWGAAASKPLTLPEGDSSATINLAALGVRLWWPAGYGAQPLYAVNATWVPAGAPAGAAAPSTARNIGVRYAAVVTINDTDAAAVAAAVSGDGTGENGMFLRVNGAAVWARGANMIPMDELEGRYSAVAHARVVRSAVDAGMNMLRVWGGGVFQMPAFYDACDELGVMVYHDMWVCARARACRARQRVRTRFRATTATV